MKHQVATGSDPSSAWGANTFNGNVSTGNKTVPELVWPVRSGRADIGSLVVDFYDQGSGEIFTDPGSPAAGFGHWYIWRPTCLVGSFLHRQSRDQTSLPGVGRHGGSRFVELKTIVVDQLDKRLGLAKDP